MRLLKFLQVKGKDANCEPVKTSDYVVDLQNKSLNCSLVVYCNI